MRRRRDSPPTTLVPWPVAAGTALWAHGVPSLLDLLDRLGVVLLPAAPVPGVLPPDQPQPGSGETAPQPPLAVGLGEVVAKEHQEHDERQRPQQGPDRDSTRPVDIQWLHVNRQATALPAHDDHPMRGLRRFTPARPRRVWHPVLADASIARPRTREGSRAREG